MTSFDGTVTCKWPAESDPTADVTSDLCCSKPLDTKNLFVSRVEPHTKIDNVTQSEYEHVKGTCIIFIHVYVHVGNICIHTGDTGCLYIHKHCVYIKMGIHSYVDVNVQTPCLSFGNG